ncbi:L-lactate dehydrogenase [Clostridium cadaveris]|uniref:L-lactate dehydrogenase n=1 Tax=Clostridium cadaveris TaxID=1529 RepID=A0A1I2K7S6_9CLOT|nr:L-lactate dehydrogenase [Clostridium cadaveris]MDM8310917.1 L-lactate dehydrogenase [Clostridium cadaveris]SFF62503.1 L-lactate dehydrogenase [Clostridium cadaveris]
MSIRKVAVIGIGHVGSHVASSIITQGICNELIIIDNDIKKALSHGEDLADTMAYMLKRVNVKVGRYEDIEDADIVVMSASGPIFKEDRLEELEGTIEVMDEIIPYIKNSGFKGIIVSISNPCDIIAYYLHEKTGLKVIGTGTVLDSGRLRARLGRQLNLDPKSIEAYCLGEHGDSQMVPWSSAFINGKPILEIMREKPYIYGRLRLKNIALDTMKAGWNIVVGKGSTEFGIGAAAAEVIRAILEDERKVLPCSTMLNGEYGETKVYASVPCVIGKSGVEEIIELNLTEKEQEEFHSSCRIIKDRIKAVVSDK